MHTDADFLAKLAADPTDDTTRLVYADWLEEQDQPEATARAEFLRVTAQLPTLKGRKGAKKAHKQRLRQLAAELDTDWLAVVSRLAIENCKKKREEGESSVVARELFHFVCDRHWEDLRPTGDQGVRVCDGCRQNVHYCDTITDAREHAWNGDCIAIDLGVIRRERDLEPMRMVVGMVGEDYFRREEERLQPDPVSAARERRKDKQGERAGE